MGKKEKKSSVFASIDSNKLRKEVGVFLIDIAKFVFGGAVLGVILGSDYNQMAVVGLGVLSVIVLAVLGIALQAQSERREY